MHATAHQPAASKPAAQAERFALAVEFGVGGDLRFITHHDTLRMLARAFVRAGLPLAYSQGFNPLPRIALPLPRGLGVASDAELAVVELAENLPVQDAQQRLLAALPAGVALRRVVPWTARRVPQAVEVVYEVDLDAPDARDMAPRAAALLAAPRVPIERDDGPFKPKRCVDIRPFITALGLSERRLTMRLRYTERGTARPAEVLSALGLSAELYAHHLRRVSVVWNMDLAGPT
jgi:radical SAM-linked protein